jgi:hypothetical protein
MRELYRRLAVLLLLFASLVCFLSVRNGFVRLYVADMGREYRQEYSPSQGLFGAQAAGGRFIRSITPFRTIAGFIDSKTDGHLLTVEGDPWPEIFSGAAAPAGSGATAWREAGGVYRKSLYYHREEEPFPALIAGLEDKGETFSYLKLRTGEGPRFLAMVLEGPGTALDNGVPAPLARPFRSLALVPLCLGAAVYFFLPKRKTPPGAIVYPKWSAVFLPDLLSYIMSGFFLGLPMVLCVHIFDRAGFLDFRFGSAWFTLVFWAIGLVFASILWWSSKYASFAFQILPGGLFLRTLGRERAIDFGDIVSAGFVDYRPPKWLRTLLFIAGLVNWRMMGQALLLSGRTDWGIEFFFRDGGSERFLCSNIPGAGRLFDALRLHKIPLSEELQRAAEGTVGPGAEEES